MKKLIRIHSLKKEDEIKMNSNYSKCSQENGIDYESYRIGDLFFDVDGKLKTIDWGKKLI